MSMFARRLFLFAVVIAIGSCGGQPFEFTSAHHAPYSQQSATQPGAASAGAQAPSLPVFDSSGGASARAAAGKPLFDPKTMEPITVSEIFVRDKGSIDIGLVPDGMRVFISEQLRKRGVNIVGFENVVFGIDKSSSARFLLGGTLVRASCDPTYRPGIQVCHLAFTWELFDPQSQVVLYRMTTRSLTALSDEVAYSSEFIQQAISTQIQSLCKRPLFAELLARGRQPDGENAAEPALTIGELRPCAAKQRQLPRDMSGALDAAVIIKAGNATGSGTIVSGDGIVVTAAHVVGDLAEVEVRTLGGEPQKARVLRVDALQDLAVVAIDGADRACVPLANELPEVGEELFVVGTPAGETLAFSVSKGIVSGVRRIDGATFIQTDAAINPGNSGGAMLDKEGRLVGVISWKMGMKGFEGLGFAAPASLVLPRLALREGDTTSISPAVAAVAKSRAGALQTIVDTEQPIPWKICIDPQTCVSTAEMINANRK
jgi:S1-C subfamily serine protease